MYSTFQSHEPEFDYLKSLEIEEKINKIRWLKRKNQSHFLLSTNDKTIKLWKVSIFCKLKNYHIFYQLNIINYCIQVSEKDKRVTGYNTREENGAIRDPSFITRLKVPTVRPMELLVEATPRYLLFYKFKYIARMMYNVISVSILDGYLPMLTLITLIVSV